MQYFVNIIRKILLFNLMWIFINPMTQSSLQNKRVTHSSMFAEVHFTNASSLPQIPMQCMHCKMLANICMSLLKLIFLWSFQMRVELLSIQIKLITNNAMQVRNSALNSDLITDHTAYSWTIMCQKCEGNCGLCILNKIRKEIYAESLKKIVGAVWELPAK